MNFGEKLFKLRKEKGFSQETLAEKLNTSRQAISKWENEQGFPETEKLLMIGNIFEVSIDYLLKDSVESNEGNEEGYYVSREMAEGFLLSTQKTAKHIGLGFSLFALAFEPYLILGLNSMLGLLLIIVIATLGVVAFATLGFDQEDYAVLKREVLLFDQSYFKELVARYENFRRKYSGVMVIGACLLTMGFLAFALEKKLDMGILVPYYPIFVVIIASGLYLTVRTLTILSAYQLLVKNEEHTNRFGFKLRQKAKKKFNDF
ncbi:transcriptional regulator [Sporosarcina sp. P21c]|uniref:helix-turn-helix domain-containing protein n=1 Tax=unclassified Sporosarcina TaxID=2647733 RepID=UPI000C16C9B0|nr:MULTISPECIES: helix-turn-helix transcriptional regulator [unclassified Sporosarcina]PIC68259.1 transcriptional regulator [Sporosarcina sp. P16a]PIC90469.1 transcriptional regulator [Sporosarcina sp. P21c]PIC94000.1 transcriptional regulator [Sporosarcina sp. P25]